MTIYRFQIVKRLPWVLLCGVLLFEIFLGTIQRLCATLHALLQE